MESSVEKSVEKKIALLSLAVLGLTAIACVPAVKPAGAIDARVTTTPTPLLPIDNELDAVREADRINSGLSQISNGRRRNLELTSATLVSGARER